LAFASLFAFEPDRAVAAGEVIEKQLSRTAIPSLGVLAGETGVQEATVIKKETAEKYPKRKVPHFRDSW
jgi:hypothetical protein